jgi:hypothetical protein
MKQSHQHALHSPSGATHRLTIYTLYNLKRGRGLGWEKPYEPALLLALFFACPWSFPLSSPSAPLASQPGFRS